MLIKFESKRAASFIMQSQVAEQLLSMAGLDGKVEGSISGAAISTAMASLEKSLAAQSQSLEQGMTDEDEREYVTLNSRAAPLQEMMRHALRIDTYVMWRPE